MIVIDFSWAIALFSILIIGSITTLWLKIKKEKERRASLEDRFIWHCAVCTYTYINTQDEFLSVCPRCGSYNKR